MGSGRVKVRSEGHVGSLWVTDSSPNTCRPPGKFVSTSQDGSLRDRWEKQRGQEREGRTVASGRVGEVGSHC